MFFPVYVCVSKSTMSRSLRVSFILPQVIVKQLVDALIESHSTSIFHRYIKLDNILFDASADVPRVKINDTWVKTAKMFY